MLTIKVVKVENQSQKSRKTNFWNRLTKAKIRSSCKFKKHNDQKTYFWLPLNLLLIALVLSVGHSR